MIKRVGDLSCTACDLAQYRKQVVQNVINPEAEITLIGLIPGKNENEHGIPFYESKRSAGHELNIILSHVGVDRSDISIMNCALCLHPENKLGKKQWNACRHHFVESMKLMPNLKIAITLGEIAYKMISGASKGSMKEAYLKTFKLEEFEGVTFVPLGHPASWLYSRSSSVRNQKKKKFEEGFKRALELLKAAKIVTKKPVYKYVLTEEDLEIALKKMRSEVKLFAYDSEATSLIPHKAKILSFHFSWEPYTALGIPFRQSVNDELVEYWRNPWHAMLVEAVEEALTDPERRSCCQNKKYDSLLLHHDLGFTIKNCAFDTMSAGFLLDPRGKHDLASLVMLYCPEIAIDKAAFWGQFTEKEKKEGTWYKNIPLESLLEYGCIDSDSTFQLANRLAGLL